MKIIICFKDRSRGDVREKVGSEYGVSESVSELAR